MAELEFQRFFSFFCVMLFEMRCPARVLCIAVVTAGWLFPAALAHAQLPDLGGGGGGGGGDVNLPVDPGNLPGDLGNPSSDLGGLGGLGGIGGGGSNADPGGQVLVPNVV